MYMKLRRLHATAGALALTVVLAGCGSVNDSSGSTSSSAKKVSDVTIGFAQRTADGPYYVAMQKEAERQAKEQGFKLLFQSANGDPVQQIDQAQTMLSQNVDVVLVNAVSPDTEKGQMQSVADKKPLLFIDTPIPGVGFTTVQSDNKKIGEESGRLMAQRIGKGKTVKLAILNGGPTDVTVGPARREGFLAGLEGGGVTAEIVAEADAGYAQDQAVGRTEDMLAAHPDIDVIFGYNDGMSLGALTVLRNQNNTRVLVGGVDGQKEALAEIQKNGCDGQFVSTGLNSPSEAAAKAIEIALAVATGKKSPKDFPAVQNTEAAGIDCNNVDTYYDPASVF
jgi:ribose transport system substrate-binding protein